MTLAAVLVVAAVAVGLSLGLLPPRAGAASAPVSATVTVNPVVHSVALDRGWNLFSPVVRPVDSATDRGLVLKQGWNLIGYSSSVPFSWDSAVVDDGAQSLGVYDAAVQGWLQYSIYYYDNGYRLVPDNVATLQESKGYWVYVFADELTVTLPAVGGSVAGNEFLWLNAEATDGTEVKGIEDAEVAGWLQLTLSYFDEELQAYQHVPADYDNIIVWNGYWLYAEQDGLELLIGS